MSRLTIGFSLCLFCISAICWADVDSGPSVNEAAPALKVKSVVGDQAGQDVEWIATRAADPTIYFFIRFDKISRPAARVLKKTDETLAKHDKTKAVVVFLADNADEASKRLELIQQSLKFDKTTLCVYANKSESPELWGINADADLTAVQVVDGKVKQRFGWVGPTEKVVENLFKDQAVK
jgi:hypothetical protein